VSTDTAETHASFAEKHGLPFPLISDRNAEIAGVFGVSRLGGWLPTKRVTFVIDKEGTVRAVIRSELDVDRHVDEALAAIESLQSAGSG
jgi:peroxiredoxin Q/BCP